jgi:hypothetical protein
MNGFVLMARDTTAALINCGLAPTMLQTFN